MIYPIHRRTEAGNVLFLILIAVALFAALSYAVTQSTRSSGDASSETNLISSASITQYPSAIRTATVRMIINGITPTELLFDPPSSFGSMTTQQLARDVFHPTGGQATFQQAPADIMASNSLGTWYFNAHFEVLNLGTTSAANADGNEIVAFLPGIKQAICSKLNDEAGIGTTVPVATVSISANYMQEMNTAYSVPASETILGTVASTASLAGQPFGCFRNTAGGDYVYYHVLVER